MTSSIVRHPWQRDLAHYPTGIRRAWYLGMGVVATIILYYQYSVFPSVSPLILKESGLSLQVYSLINIAVAVAGGIAALLGGLSDRFGRANLTIIGILISSLFAVALSLAPNITVFIILVFLLGLEEGVIFAATPALVRDFSPRLSRALGMGFWLIGPIGGGFLAQFVASQTLHSFGTWQSQFMIAGIVGLVFSAICFFGLRDLSPQLRDQIISTTREKEIVEARARNIDVEEAVKHPWRQVLRPRVLLAILGICFSLIIATSLLAFFPIYLSSSSTFHYSVADANGLVSIFSIVNVVVGVVAGYLSDRLLVRKPFMLGGALVTIIAFVIFISRTFVSGTPYPVMAVLFACFGIGLATLNGTWFAAYSETIEDINPALVGTGFALYGSMVRILGVVTILAFIGVVGNGAGYGIWWWICVTGLILFIPSIFLLSGYWSSHRSWATERAKGLDIEPGIPTA